VERAFDSVWRDALLHKLILRGCNIFLVRIIYSFLNHRTFQVIVGKSKSSICKILYGVPQGAVLSSTFYNFFTSDVPRPMSVSLLHSPMTLPYLCPVRTQRLSAMDFRSTSTLSTLDSSKIRLSTLPDAALHCGSQALG
jgi:hypothetical protein